MNKTQETGTIFLEVKYGWQFLPILPLTLQSDSKPLNLGASPQLEHWSIGVMVLEEKNFFISS